MVPAAVGFVVLGREIATVVFGYQRISVEEARFIGLLLGVFALGLVPFSTYQLQLRSFYAMQDTRTPTLINLGVNLTLVTTGVLLYVALPDRYEVLGLAAGHATSFVVGLLVCSRVVGRRTGRTGGGRVLRTALRCLLATLLPALLAGLAAAGATSALGRGPLGAAVAVAAGGAVLGIGYVLLVRRLRVGEVDEVLGPVLRRVPGLAPRRSP
jgi:putative peptidoglycan lipid II flippase